MFILPCLGVRRAPLQACFRVPCQHLHARARVPRPTLSKGRIAAASVTVISIGLGGYLAWPSSSRRALTSSSLPLSPNHFTPVTVESSKTNPLDPSTKIITIRIPPTLLPPECSFLQPIHSIYIKDDDIQVERPYTPLFGIEQSRDAASLATFWVKRYPHGEVGRWLHSKRVGDVLEIRGPVPTWNYAQEMEDGKWDEVIMISGGTGITPFFQLLQKRFGPSAEEPTNFRRTHFTLMHGSSSLVTLPPTLIMSYLDEVAENHRESFTMKLFVEREHDVNNRAQLEDFASGHITKKHIEDILVQRGILQSAVEVSWWRGLLSRLDWRTRSRNQAEPLPTAKNVLFLVCGPEPMIEAIAGPRPKMRTNQERMGMLGELGYKAANVRRL